MAEVLQWKKDKGADKEVGIPNNNAQQSKSKRVVSLKGGFAGLRGIKTKSSTLAMQQLRKTNELAPVERAPASDAKLGPTSAARIIDSGANLRPTHRHERKPSYSPVSSFPSDDNSALLEEDDSILGQTLTSISEFFSSGSNQVVMGLAIGTLAAVLGGIALEAHARGGSFGILVETLLKSVGLFELGQATTTIGTHSRILANLLQITFTVSAIAVQLAASRFSPIVSELFIRDTNTRIIMILLIFSLLWSCTTQFLLVGTSLWIFGMATSYTLMMFCILLVLPYFVYLFQFLQPEKIIGVLMNEGLVSLDAAALHGNLDEVDLGKFQHAFVEAVEKLYSLLTDAIGSKNKSFTQQIMESLTYMAVEYGTIKELLPSTWYQVPSWLRNNPDFISLSGVSVQDICVNRTWVEWAVLKQHQYAFRDAFSRTREFCLLVAINTRRLAEAAHSRGDRQVLTLCIKFFNTYLHMSLLEDDNTASMVLHQYHKLGIYLLVPGELANDAEDDLTATGLVVKSDIPDKQDVDKVFTKVKKRRMTGGKITRNGSTKVAPLVFNTTAIQHRIKHKQSTADKLSSGSKSSVKSHSSVKLTGSPVPAGHAINEDEEEGSEAEEQAPASNPALDTGDVVIEIARFFRYYCNVSAKKRLEKCVELLAHDCASLVYRAFALRRVYHEELLRIFLTFDDMKEVRRFKSCLHGVRRAQVKLATNYLVDGEEEFAKRIRDDMDVEDSSTLQGLWEEIVSLNRRDFWEITDRGSNVNYLSTLQMTYLKQFFSMFETAESDGESTEESNGQVLRSISTLQTVFSERVPGSGKSQTSSSNLRRADDALRKVDSDIDGTAEGQEATKSQMETNVGMEHQLEAAAIARDADDAVAENNKALLASIDGPRSNDGMQADKTLVDAESKSLRFAEESRIASTQYKKRRRSSAGMAWDPENGGVDGSVGLQEFAKMISAMVQSSELLVDKRSGGAATRDLVQSLADARSASALAAQNNMGKKKRKAYNRNLDLNMDYRGGQGLGRIMSRGPGFMRGSLGPGFNPLRFQGQRGHSAGPSRLAQSNERLPVGKKETANGNRSPGGGFTRNIVDNRKVKRGRSNSVGTIPAADGKPGGLRLIQDISTFD